MSVAIIVQNVWLECVAKPKTGSGLQLNTKDTKVSATVNSPECVSICLCVCVYWQINPIKKLTTTTITRNTNIKRRQDAVLDNFDICIAFG